MANPNPSRITNAMWRMWTQRPGRSWRLGGIFANKPHYHNTVDANLARWPDSYSVRFPLDTRHGPDDKARAIDYTMSDADMKLYTQRLVDACDRQDPRVRGLREFYGTVDGRNVVGRIRDTDSGPFRFARSDKSHTWHIHLAVWAAYCANWAVLSGIISVLRGESLEQWEGGGFMLPKLNDDSEDVGYWQSVLNALGVRDQNNEALKVDNEYGPKTASAVKRYWQAAGGTGNFAGEYLPGWLAAKMHEAWFTEIAESHGAKLPGEAVLDLPDSITVPVVPVEGS